MRLDIDTLEGGAIGVSCALTLRGGSMRFALASSLEISGLRRGGEVLPPPAGEPCELPFRPQMSAYTLRGEPGDEFTFTYSGRLGGALLYFQSEVRHFSLYNGWYPMEFDADTDIDVTLPGDIAWELIQGRYDAARGLWRYTTRGRAIPDCNILLLRRGWWTRLESGALRLYYCEADQALPAGEAIRACSKIRAFYRSLYGREGASRELTLVYLPHGQDWGAYMRDGLVVFSSLPKDTSALRHTLAHELGHAYACRADSLSWEDWLNETGAEWSALLYELRADRPAFELRLDKLLELSESHPLRLRPLDGSRPDDVHETGTLVFARIYKKYGEEAIITLLRTLDGLQQPDTAALLSALRARGEDSLAGELDAYISPQTP